jgi:hypothetical protein
MNDVGPRKGLLDLAGKACDQFSVLRPPGIADVIGKPHDLPQCSLCVREILA